MIDERDQRGESQIFGASTRFWLALLITFTTCLMAAMGTKIEEPLYSGFMLSLGFYFGQKLKTP